MKRRASIEMFAQIIVLAITFFPMFVVNRIWSRLR